MPTYKGGVLVVCAWPKLKLSVAEWLSSKGTYLLSVGSVSSNGRSRTSYLPRYLCTCSMSHSQMQKGEKLRQQDGFTRPPIRYDIPH